MLLRVQQQPRVLEAAAAALAALISTYSLPPSLVFALVDEWYGIAMSRPGDASTGRALFGMGAVLRSLDLDSCLRGCGVGVGT